MDSELVKTRDYGSLLPKSKTWRIRYVEQGIWKHEEFYETREEAKMRVVELKTAGMKVVALYPPKRR